MLSEQSKYCMMCAFRSKQRPPCNAQSVWTMRACKMCTIIQHVRMFEEGQHAVATNMRAPSRNVNIPPPLPPPTHWNAYSNPWNCARWNTRDFHSSSMKMYLHVSHQPLSDFVGSSRIQKIFYWPSCFPCESCVFRFFESSICWCLDWIEFRDQW